VKRIPALVAAVGIVAPIVFLPGGAGAGEESGPGVVPRVAVPAPAPAAVPAPVTVTAPPAVTAAVQAVAAALPAPLPGPVAAVVNPPAPTDDEHMAELCRAREVFCQVDTSGHYTDS
jgi:hypothetical protein